MSTEYKDVVSAEDVFKELGADKVAVPEPKPEPGPRRKEYTSKSDRINRELMRLALLKLKYIHDNSFQHDVVQAAEDVARYLVMIIELNPALFPGLLKGGKK